MPKLKVLVDISIEAREPIIIDVALGESECEDVERAIFAIDRIELLNRILEKDAIIRIDGYEWDAIDV